MHLLKHLIFFAPFLTFYYYAFNVQTFCYAFAHPRLPFRSPPQIPRAHLQLCCRPFMRLALRLPFGRTYSHAISTSTCCTESTHIHSHTHWKGRQLRRIEASGFLFATKAFVANNFFSLWPGLLQLECVLSADTKKIYRFGLDRNALHPWHEQLRYILYIVYIPLYMFCVYLCITKLESINFSTIKFN